MSKARILIVEDDKDINELLFDHLTLKGHFVTSCHDGAVAKNFINTKNFDLFLLDWMLPNLNGLELCKIIREKSNDVPILFLTAKSDQDNIISGLNFGANDYITKPFNLAELTARVNVQLRGLDFNKSLTYKDLKMNLEQRTVEIDMKRVQLTKSEFTLLKCLLENKNKVLDRERLIKNLQGDSTVVTSRTVDTHMTGLRKKIKEYSKNIISIRGIGYKFED